MHKNISPVITIVEGIAKTTSLNVAEVFGKHHKDVLKVIKNIECSEEFRLHNFAPTSYLDSQGKIQPMYEITRDGFSFLGMGFTGKKAAQWKEAYITAFNRMETALNQQPITHTTVEELIRALLSARPQWKSILRYRQLGLSQREIALLLRVSRWTLQYHFAGLVACGLLKFPGGVPSPLYLQVITAKRVPYQ